jgi:DNA-binding beta-propeller fold protein YncE
MAVTSGAEVGILSIRIYDAPYSSASVPRLTFTPAAFRHPRQLVWDDSGDLWLADDDAGQVYEFRAPFSVRSEPATAIAFATQPAGLAIDPRTGSLFIGDLGGKKTCAVTECRVYVVPAPYTGKPVAEIATAHRPPYALGVDPLGRLFVGVDDNESTGRIEVYVPPFTSGASPAFTLFPGGRPRTFAFDSDGNLIVQLLDGGKLVEFTAPIERSHSTPAVTLGCPRGVACTGPNWAGLAFGP